MRIILIIVAVATFGLCQEAVAQAPTKEVVVVDGQVSVNNFPNSLDVRVEVKPYTQSVPCEFGAGLADFVCYFTVPPGYILQMEQISGSNKRGNAIYLEVGGDATTYVMPQTAFTHSVNFFYATLRSFAAHRGLTNPSGNPYDFRVIGYADDTGAGFAGTMSVSGFLIPAP